jgi:hypothetical protein
MAVVDISSKRNNGDEPPRYAPLGGAHSDRNLKTGSWIS